MKAENARAFAKEATISEIAEINQKILDEAKKGNTQITVSAIKQGTEAYLKDEGFEIEKLYFDTSDNRYSQVIIKW